MNQFFIELSWLIRHKGALLILLGAPVLYAFFYPLPYQQAVVADVPIIIFDAQQSSQSLNWSERLNAHPKLKVIAKQAAEPSELMWQQFPSAQAFVYIPANADQRLAWQQQVDIAYGGKTDNFLVYSTAMRAIAETLNALNIEFSEQALGRLKGNDLLAQLQAEPINFQVTSLFNGQASYMQYLVPAVFMLMAQQVIMIALGMQWGYRFEMQRPVGNPFAVWCAQLAIYLLSGLALIAFFYCVVLPLQGVAMAATGLELLSVAMPFVLSVIGFAMVVSIGFREQETAIIWLLPVSVPLLLLAGTSWPSFAMAPWLQSLAPIVPSTWGINAMIDVAFMNQLPDYPAGWLGAFIWLALALLVRVLVHEKPEVVDPASV